MERAELQEGVETTKLGGKNDRSKDQRSDRAARSAAASSKIQEVAKKMVKEKSDEEKFPNLFLDFVEHTEAIRDKRVSEMPREAGNRFVSVYSSALYNEYMNIWVKDAILFAVKKIFNVWDLVGKLLTVSTMGEDGAEKACFEYRVALGDGNAGLSKFSYIASTIFFDPSAVMPISVSLFAGYELYLTGKIMKRVAEAKAINALNKINIYKETIFFAQKVIGRYEKLLHELESIKHTEPEKYKKIKLELQKAITSAQVTLVSARIKFDCVISQMKQVMKTEAEMACVEEIRDCSVLNNMIGYVDNLDVFSGVWGDIKSSRDFAHSLYERGERSTTKIVVTDPEAVARVGEFVNYSISLGICGYLIGRVFFSDQYKDLDDVAASIAAGTPGLLSVRNFDESYKKDTNAAKLVLFGLTMLFVRRIFNCTSKAMDLFSMVKRTKVAAKRSARHVAKLIGDAGCDIPKYKILNYSYEDSKKEFEDMQEKMKAGLASQLGEYADQYIKHAQQGLSVLEHQEKLQKTNRKVEKALLSLDHPSAPEILKKIKEGKRLSQGSGSLDKD